MNAPSNKLKGGAGILSGILMAIAAYLYHQANVLSTKAANIQNDTSLDPGLSMRVVSLTILTIVILGVSISVLARGGNSALRDAN